MRPLTPEEQQEIISLVRAGKPLPGKYRFLLFEEPREVELVWNGRTDAVCDTVLPLRPLERFAPSGPTPESGSVPKAATSPDMRPRTAPATANAPRSAAGRGGSSRPHPAPPPTPWTNKLILGDNRLILSSLVHGPLGAAIRDRGGVKLIYIDPPFAVGTDFSMNSGGKNAPVRAGGELAYRDTWGSGQDSFPAMLAERLRLMRGLLAEDGSIFVHCDWRSSALVRLLMDDIFGLFRNEIIWHYTGGGRAEYHFSRKHDTIFWYSPGARRAFNADAVRVPYKKTSGYARTGIRGANGKHYSPNPLGTVPDDVWDIPIINPLANERLGYPTQKPEALLERIILAASNPGDLVADFFCGSGTTAAVAEKLSRDWIAADQGLLAVHTARKRLVGVRRELAAGGRECPGFDVLGLDSLDDVVEANGIQMWAPSTPAKSSAQGLCPRPLEPARTLPDLDPVNGELPGDSHQYRRRVPQEQAEPHGGRAAPDTAGLVLAAYGAEPAAPSRFFHGTRGGRAVCIAPGRAPLSRAFVLGILEACRAHGPAGVDILAFSFAPDLFPSLPEAARRAGIDAAFLRIPHDVFDRRTLEKQQAVFHPAAGIEARLIRKNGLAAVELTGLVLYGPPALPEGTGTKPVRPAGHHMTAGLPAGPPPGGLPGQQPELRPGLPNDSPEPAWADGIDYWAVDFAPDTHAPPESPSGGGDAAVFTSRWQTFRTRKRPGLLLRSPFFPCPEGRAAVKAADALGNVSMTFAAAVSK